MSRTAILLLPLVLAACDGPHALGRSGNAALAAGELDAARAHYADALAALDTTASDLRADLLFNAGVAEGDPSASVALFDSSRRATPPGDARRLGDAAFNAGVAADAARAPAAALDRFRLALLADADDADARHNWEYVARKQEQQRQQGGQNPPPEPSDYARRVKEQADALVAQERYGAAFALMQQALARDETVAAFQTFTDRVAAVARIDSDPTGAPR